MNTIAVLMTCYNRKEKTIACLKSLYDSYCTSNSTFEIELFLTDDGCTDGTAYAVNELNLGLKINIIKGNGALYWNGGMICAWKSALRKDGFDGFLLLNDDTIVLPEFWNDLKNADEISIRRTGKKGVYVGSTYDKSSQKFTYGGFNFVSKWTLKDVFVYPNGKDFQQCQCAHGNITYISNDVVKTMGIFCEDYIHGGSDHDYTYRAYKKGFPIFVMPHYCGICENDHLKERKVLSEMSFVERLRYMRSPFGYNLHNTLLFQKRCFPHRYPFVLVMGVIRLLFPAIAEYLYLRSRK